MFYSPYRRSRWRRVFRGVTLTVIVLTFLDLFAAFRTYRTFNQNLTSSTVQHVEDLPRAAQNQKIYICAQFWTSADTIASFWADALINLINTLGRHNVYISIIESGSLDDTADIVRLLDERLEEMGVERTIIIDPTTHEDLVNQAYTDKHGVDKAGWIHTGDSNPPGLKEMRRIPYLADIRNQGLEPLLRMKQKHGRTFDKILYLNDVVFNSSDVLTLMATNKGSFSVACGLDFHYPPAFYDTFAARDVDGVGPVMASFPFFRSSQTRDALLAGMPAEVRSCWNGIVLVDADPYYNVSQTSHGSSSKEIAGLRFRGVSDTLATQHLEASECCLIHADLIDRGLAKRGIFMNPAVRVGYTKDAYRLTHLGSDGMYMTFMQYVRGLIINRVARWRADGVSSSAGQNMAEVYRKIAAWERQGKEVGEERFENGGYCTIHEMHILIWNGWKHVWRQGQQH